VCPKRTRHAFLDHGEVIVSAPYGCGRYACRRCGPDLREERLWQIVDRLGDAPGAPWLAVLTHGRWMSGVGDRVMRRVSGQNGGLIRVGLYPVIPCRAEVDQGGEAVDIIVADRDLSDPGGGRPPKVPFVMRETPVEVAKERVAEAFAKLQVVKVEGFGRWILEIRPTCVRCQQRLTICTEHWPDAVCRYCCPTCDWTYLGRFHEPAGWREWSPEERDEWVRRHLANGLSRARPMGSDSSRRSPLSRARPMGRGSHRTSPGKGTDVR
jgi:hypothetical protein